MMQVQTYGALVFCAMSFFMGFLLLKQRSTQTHTEGEAKISLSLLHTHTHTHTHNVSCQVKVCSPIFNLRELWVIYSLYRIVQVDLKFPPKPIVSSAAKDLISQVQVNFNIPNIDLEYLHWFMPIWQCYCQNSTCHSLILPFGSITHFLPLDQKHWGSKTSMMSWQVWQLHFQFGTINGGLMNQW